MIHAQFKRMRLWEGTATRSILWGLQLDYLVLTGVMEQS